MEPRRRSRCPLLTRPVQAILGIAAFATVGCGASPTTPNPTTTVRVVGPSSLTPGLTAQLQVEMNDGSLVTSGLSWKSQSPAVASVSQTGFLTAIGIGTTIITATAPGLSGQIPVAVQPAPTGTATITSCATISTPGQYTVTGDLSGLNNCITVSGAGSVRLDCAGHKVPGITVLNAVAITVTNCSVITNPIQVSASTSVTVSSSTVTVNLMGMGAGISFTGGGSNVAKGNTLSGGYDGGKANVGTDDGIVLIDEMNDDIENNTISSFFDQGVEAVGILAGTTIANNTLSNIGSSAVGSYYCTSWTNNVIRGNQVSNSATLTLAGYNLGRCGALIPPPAFSGNQFIGNVFRDPSPGTLGGPFGPTTVSGPSMFVQMSGTVTGNVLQGNDFGSNAGPNLIPLSGFIDGGGNICAPLDPSVSNFVCTGSGFQSRRRSLLWSGPVRPSAETKTPTGARMSRARSSGRSDPGRPLAACEPCPAAAFTADAVESEYGKQRPSRGLER
jgi:Bacterial Ig-like domain (group 2)